MRGGAVEVEVVARGGQRGGHQPLHEIDVGHAPTWGLRGCVDGDVRVC